MSARYWNLDMIRRRGIEIERIEEPKRVVFIEWLREPIYENIGGKVRLIGFIDNGVGKAFVWGCEK